MSTATFIATVSRRHRIRVDFTLHHRRTPTDVVGSAHAYDSPAFLEQMEAYRADQENSIKTAWPDLVSVDTSRDAESISFVPSGPAQWDHTWTHTISCDVRIYVDVDTELAPEDAGEVFQQAADDAAQTWIDSRSLIAI